MLLRGMEVNEKDILRDFLYEAIFIPEGVKPPDGTNNIKDDLDELLRVINDSADTEKSKILQLLRWKNYSQMPLFITTMRMVSQSKEKSLD